MPLRDPQTYTQVHTLLLAGRLPRSWLKKQSRRLKPSITSDKNFERHRKGKKRDGRRKTVYLSTTWSLVGCGAMVFLTYWYTSVLSSRVSTTRLSSRSSSQWACSLINRVRTSSGLAGTSTVTFHSRSGNPSCT